MAKKGVPMRQLKIMAVAVIIHLSFPLVCTGEWVTILNKEVDYFCFVCPWCIPERFESGKIVKKAGKHVRNIRIDVSTLRNATWSLSAPSGKGGSEYPIFRDKTSWYECIGPGEINLKRILEQGYPATVFVTISPNCQVLTQVKAKLKVDVEYFGIGP